MTQVGPADQLGSMTMNPTLRIVNLRRSSVELWYRGQAPPQLLPGSVSQKFNGMADRTQYQSALHGEVSGE